MTSDDQQHGEGRALPAHRLDHADFSRMLVKVIDNVQQDPAQYRNLIYEMARVQLQREAWHRDPPMNILEFRRMMLALETAIERVETEAAQRDATTALAPGDAIARAEEPVTARQAVVLLDDTPRYAHSGPAAALHSRRTKRLSVPLKAIARLGVLFLLAGVSVIALNAKFHWLGSTPSLDVEAEGTSVLRSALPPAAASTSPVTPAQPSPPSTMLPNVYGVYAMTGGKLYELEPLVGRAPDLRMFMSAAFKTPSRTVLPDGEVSFIVYRRDMVSSAPDRVSVRVIAKVARSLTFSKTGQPVTATVEGEWAVRNVSLDYRVAPSRESAEMIVIKPDSAAPPLAPGRYALIIKGQMFDFTIDGRITHTSQCLERTEAANGTFYSECRQLP
jgi:hypothetical protein